MLLLCSILFNSSFSELFKNIVGSFFIDLRESFSLHYITPPFGRLHFFPLNDSLKSMKNEPTVFLKSFEKREIYTTNSS